MGNKVKQEILKSLKTRIKDCDLRILEYKNNIKDTKKEMSDIKQLIKSMG